MARSAGGWLCALSPSPNPLPFGHPPSLGRGEMVFHRFSLLPLEGGGAQRRRLASLSFIFGQPPALRASPFLGKGGDGFSPLFPPSSGRRWRVAPEVGFTLFRLRPPPCPSSIVSNDRHLPFLHCQIKKRTPASESANPSSQHQLDGFIVLILAKRRKVNHS